MAVVDLTPLTPEERGLVALLKMRDEGNAFVGQWEITEAGEARRIPSRVVTLGGPELLIGGLTALERDLVQEREIDWQTYGLAAVDVAAIGAGVALLRFARTAARVAPAATRARTATLRSGALATARVLGVGAVRYGVPIGLVALMVLHPAVFTHYLWLLAESLGFPGHARPAHRLGHPHRAARVSSLLAAAVRSPAAPCRLAVRRRGARLPPSGHAPGSRWSLDRDPRHSPAAGTLVRPGQMGCIHGRAWRPYPCLAALSTIALRPKKTSSKGREHAPTIPHDHEHRRHHRPRRGRSGAHGRGGARAVRLSTTWRHCSRRRGRAGISATPSVVTYSPKVFIPLTQLCRDVCRYCTFARAPRDLGAPYLSVDEAIAIADGRRPRGLP